MTRCVACWVLGGERVPAARRLLGLAVCQACWRTFGVEATQRGRLPLAEPEEVQ